MNAVRDLNPKVSQMTIILRDIAKHKFAALATIIGLISGALGIYTFPTMN